MDTHNEVVESRLNNLFLGDRVKVLTRLYPSIIPIVIKDYFRYLDPNFSICVEYGHPTLWLASYIVDKYTCENYHYLKGKDSWDDFIGTLNGWDKKYQITPKARLTWGIGQSNNEIRGNDMKYNLPKIKDVEWNIQKKTGYPCTVVFWEDGVKTSVVCNTTFDKFSVETGIMACYMKRLFGNNGSYNNILHKWEKKYYDEGQYNVLGLNFTGKKATTPIMQNFCSDKKED